MLLCTLNYRWLFLFTFSRIIFSLPLSLSPLIDGSFFIQVNIQFIMHGLGPSENTQILFIFIDTPKIQTHTHKMYGCGKTADDDFLSFFFEKPFYFTYQPKLLLVIFPILILVFLLSSDQCLKCKDIKTRRKEERNEENDIFLSLRGNGFSSCCHFVNSFPIVSLKEYTISRLCLGYLLLPIFEYRCYELS